MRKFSCHLCGISVNTIRILCDHVLGFRHRAMVAQVAPEELKQLGRLQNFIHSYMKGMHILGLEYVMEKQVDFTYLYTCMLCKKELGCAQMVSHIIDEKHMANYINTHHMDLLGTFTYPTWESYKKALKNAAAIICKRFGHREVREMQSNTGTPDLAAVAGPSSKEDNKNNSALPSTDDDDDLQTEYAQEELTNNSIEQEKQPKKCPENVKGGNGRDSYTCNLCSKNFFTPLHLCSHVMGGKHFRKMLLVKPEEVNGYGSLSYLLRKHLKNVPILGLEYILEIKEGFVYKFSCQLCGVDGSLHSFVSHILGIDHMKCYIKKHHKDLWPSVQNCNKKHIEALTVVAKTILEIHGRKEILSKDSTGNDSTQSKTLPGVDSKKTEAIKAKENTMPPSKCDSGSRSRLKRRPSPCRDSGLDEGSTGNGHKEMLEKSETDGPPLAKKGRLLPEDDLDALPGISDYNDPCMGYNKGRLLTTSTHVPGLESTTAEQEEFRTNDQLLEYLANFVIEDEEDATFIQKILQNCVKALKNFEEEEEAEKLKSSHKPEAPLTHTSSRDPGYFYKQSGVTFIRS